jgi:hypothetical protein
MPEVDEGRKGWPAGHVCGRPTGHPSAPNRLKLAVEILLTSYKYPHIPLGIEEIRKRGLTSYSAPKFILYRVERERERGEVLRVRGLLDLSGVLQVAHVLPKSVQVQRSFLSSSSIVCGSSTRIL